MAAGRSGIAVFVVVCAKAGMKNPARRRDPNFRRGDRKKGIMRRNCVDPNDFKCSPGDYSGKDAAGSREESDETSANCLSSRAERELEFRACPASNLTQ